MPVALRTKSWEDHVTPHSRKQYSYDDLDLVCCHASFGGSASPTGQRQRERCASMPECSRHRPGFESCPQEDRNRRRKVLSGAFMGIAASYHGKNSQKGQIFLRVNKAMADEDVIQSNDSPSHDHSVPISNHFHYESIKEIQRKDEEITSKTMSGSSGSTSANSPEEHAKKLDFFTMVETKDISKEISSSEMIPNNAVTTGLTGTPETNGEPMVEGNVGDPVVEASLLRHQQEVKVDVEATIMGSDKFDPESSLVSDLTTDIKQSEASQIPKNGVVPNIIVNIPNSNNDQTVPGEEVLQVHNLNASTELECSPTGSASNPDKCRDCHFNLDAIPEVSFTELGDEVVRPAMENMPGSHNTTTSGDPKGAGNSNGSSVQLEMQKDTSEAGGLGNLQNIIPGDLADCESSLESRMEASNHVMTLQTSPSMDDVDRDPKAQEVPVRLRARKVRYADLLNAFVSFSQGY